MGTFVTFNRETRTVDIVGSYYFSAENGFSIEEIQIILALNVGEIIIVGMDDMLVMRVWDYE